MPEISSKILSDEFEHILHNNTNVLFDRWDKEKGEEKVQRILDENDRGSILLNSNLEFKEWVNIFHDERMTTAIIDRLIHNSRIVLFNGESYRYKVQKMKVQQNRQKT